MREKYCINGVEKPMLHVAEGNLLLRIFKERLKIYREEGKISQGRLGRVNVTLYRHWDGREDDIRAFEMTMQNEDVVDELRGRLLERCQMKVHGGWIALALCIYSVEELNEVEARLSKCLLADVAEVLKLFANGDCFLRISADKLIAEIAQETGIADPTAWTRAYLEPPEYMQRPEVRRYYRLYRCCLNKAQPQILLNRKPEELVNSPCRGGMPT